jgi:drug/metabolite transporter (DMT)-like permease
MGVALSGAGGFLYFGRAAIPPGGLPGLIAALAALASNSLSTIIGREVNRTRLYSPLQVTLVSMGAGSGALLLIGLVVEGAPSISLRGWITIIWLAAVNTAFAFTLWNHTLRTLTAVESSVINSTMLLWIPILAVLFLGETLTAQQILGLVGVGAGAVLVQVRGRPKAAR